MNNVVLRRKAALCDWRFWRFWRVVSDTLLPPVSRAGPFSRKTSGKCWKLRLSGMKLLLWGVGSRSPQFVDCLGQVVFLDHALSPQHGQFCRSLGCLDDMRCRESRERVYQLGPRDGIVKLDAGKRQPKQLGDLLLARGTAPETRRQSDGRGLRPTMLRHWSLLPTSQGRRTPPSVAAAC